MPDSHPILQFSRVAKRFGDVEVIPDLSFDLASGERVSIIGPSGSGKTTILRLAIGLEPISEGTISIDGNVAFSATAGRPPERRQHPASLSKLGMVFQSYNLFPHLTAMENIVEAPIHVLKMNPREAEERAASLLKSVGLSGFERRYPSEMSGGQQQRVAIARALAMQPKVMLLDEITSALDPELVNEVLQVVRRLARETSMAMLVVTHEMRFAREVSDRIMVFERGRLVEQGTPEKIFTDPSEPRTREFLQAISNH